MSTPGPGDGDPREPGPEQPGWQPPQLNVPDEPARGAPEPGPDSPVAGQGAPQGPQPPGGTPMPGRIQRQEPGVTQPRPPTVAEARARVVLVIDKTGSMHKQYRRRVVHRVVER
ncbi:VWA domain-containing protein, partial [Nocardia farcinica]|uniref:VWA domain-containing protein n=1 Tax=Nocardia farcinica TaxID=37329 RepID=UPI0024539AB5